MLYSSQHQCGAGQWVERRDDISGTGMPKRRDLIVGKHVMIRVLAGGICIAARRCKNKVANFSYRRPHRSRFRPPDEPVAKYATTALGQVACVHHCLACESVVSSNEQRDPIQIIALLDESRFDFAARSKAVTGLFLVISFC